MSYEVKRTEISGDEPVQRGEYEGHESEGYSCLRCGAHIRPAPRWRQLHDEFHQRVG